MVLIQKQPKAIKIGSTDIKKVYIGSTQIRPKMREPDPSRTLIYLPLNSTDLSGDKSGNYRSVSSVGSQIAYGTYANVDCAFIYGNSKLYSTFTLPAKLTILCRVNYRGGSNGSRFVIAFDNNQFTYIYKNGSSYSIYNYYINTSNSSTYMSAQFTSSTEQKWSLLVLRHDGTKRNVYLINPYETTTINITNGQAASPGNYVYIGNTPSGSVSFAGYMSRYIVENYARTDDEITAYYNQTKSNYGY